MRAGNFAEICTAGFNASGMCNDPNQQLWDPYVATWSNSAGGPVRTQFIPFNNIANDTSPGAPNNPLPQRPGNLIDPVGQQIMSYFPMPNLGVGTAGYLSAKVAWGRDKLSQPNCYPNALDPCSTGPRSADRVWRHQLDPHLQSDHPAGSLARRTRNYVDRPGVGGDFPNFNYISELGLPSYMSASGLSAAPSI